MPLSEDDKTGVPPKKPTGNEIKKDLDFTGKLYRLINKVHIVDIRDSTKPDAEYANAFKISCEKENISNVVTVFNEHYINVVYTDSAKYLVDCKFKIIAISETDLNESYKNLRKRKNSAADVPEEDNKEGNAIKFESSNDIEGYDPTYGCGYTSSEFSNNNAETVHAEIIKNSGEKEFCYKCGKKLVKGASFCSYCGATQDESGKNGGNALNTEVVKTKENPTPISLITLAWITSFSSHLVTINNIAIIISITSLVITIILIVSNNKIGKINGIILLVIWSIGFLWGFIPAFINAYQGAVGR